MYPPSKAFFDVKCLFKSNPHNWKDTWKRYFEADDVFGFGSARFALLELLSQLKTKKPDGEIILPAYTCPSVFEAVIESGLKTVYCDLDPQNLKISFEDLKSKVNQNTVGVLLCHLYGVDDNSFEISNYCEDKNIILIEDLSLSFGEKDDYGILQGHNADYIVFSLGFGKKISTGNGGLLVRKHGHNNRFYLELSDRLSNSFSLVLFFKLLFFHVLTHKLIFGLIMRTPFKLSEQSSPKLDLNEKTWTVFQANLSAKVLESYIKYRPEIKNENEYFFIKRFKQIPLSSFNRIPIIINDNNEKLRLISKIREAGYCASVGFEDCGRYIANSDCQFSKELAKKLITIPNVNYIDENKLSFLKKFI